MRPDLVIFGSCVTRDPLDRSDLRPRLKYYHARSNLASLAAPEPYPRPFRIEGFPRFQTGCIERDLTKTIDFDHRDCTVIFDFIDDRMPVAVMGGRMFTRNLLVEARHPDLFAGAETLNHILPGHADRAAEFARAVFDRQRPLFEANRIVLHRANFSRHFDGAAPQPHVLKMYVDHFERLFDLVERTWKIDHLIDCMEMVTGPEATPRDHMWGHSPFHFFDAYNDAFNSRLMAILGTAPVAADSAPPRPAAMRPA